MPPLLLISIQMFKRSSGIIFFVCLITTVSAADQEPAAYKTAGITGMHYNDSDKNVLNGISADFSVPLNFNKLELNAVVNSVFASDSKGSQDYKNISLFTKHALSNNVRISAGGGVSVFDKSEHPNFFLDFDWNSDPLRGKVLIERSSLYQTADILRNEIMYYGLDSKLTMRIAERFSPKAEVTLRSYSDNNESVRLRGDLPIKLLSDPVNWSIGYRQEFVSFRRQSRSGYFDPNAVNSYQAVTMLTGVFPPYSFHAEVFGGIQQARRYGMVSENNFVGVYTYARVDSLGPFSIILDNQTSDYSLATPNGFRFYQINLRAEATW